MKIQAQSSKRKAPRKKACGFLRGRQSYSVKLKAISKIIPNYSKVLQIIPNQYQNPNVQNSKLYFFNFVLNFEFWSFEFIWNLEF